MIVVVPRYVRVGLVARLCHMRTRDVRGMLAGAGVIVRYSGQRFWVSSDRLRDTFPDAYAAVFSYFEAKGEYGPRFRELD